jgi:hypothetical protein
MNNQHDNRREAQADLDAQQDSNEEALADMNTNTAVDAARAAYDAAVKAHAVASKCGSADLAAMFDARIAAELILLRAIIASDAASKA